MTRKPTFLCQTLGLALALAASPSLGQMPPPEHNAATSAPLFVGDLPVGTVSVRVSHPSMTDPVANVNVVGSWTTKDGKSKSATVMTGEDGRAIFAGVPANSTFGAMATVEGENLTTAQFTVPEQGGTRLLIILGAQAALDMNEMIGEPAAGQRVQPKPLGGTPGQGATPERIKGGHMGGG